MSLIQIMIHGGPIQIVHSEQIRQISFRLRNILNSKTVWGTFHAHAPAPGYTAAPLTPRYPMEAEQRDARLEDRCKTSGEAKKISANLAAISHSKREWFN